MIRFCDREVYCISGNELDNETRTIVHFLNEHKDELLCITDEEGRFVGSITYPVFLKRAVGETQGKVETITSYETFAEIIKGSINRDYLIFDENIWKNGREYFRRQIEKATGIIFVPVLDKEYHLISLAWQDDEANREIRMLDELAECGDAPGFRDMYPEYDEVTVYGCNELAYYFIQYLEKSGVSVNAMDAMWDECGVWSRLGRDQNGVLDYRRYPVYGEGSLPCKKEVGLRESVSAEFECIDKIYEESICRGIIRDAQGSMQELAKKLQGKKIGISGTGGNSLNAYDLLLENEVDIYCFLTEDIQQQGAELFGKKVIGKAEALKSIDGLIVIETDEKYSAWGFGGTDFYHYYYGLKRNERFFLLRDYGEIPNRGVPYMLSHMVRKEGARLLLAGDRWLCLRLRGILEKQGREFEGKILYCDVLEEYAEEKLRMDRIGTEEIQRTDTCLLLVPEYYHYDPMKCYLNHKAVKNNYAERLKAYSLTVVDYPLESSVFMDNIVAPDKSEKVALQVRKIIIGAITPYSGNIFFRGLLDGHPEIMMLEYSSLNSNLFSICEKLSMAEGADILKWFWELFEREVQSESQNDWGEDKRKKFSRSMGEMLSEKEIFTSQEIFVMIHIAYARMWGQEIKNISDMTIYWEPHCVPANKCEDYAVWLDKAAMSGCILNVVRNAWIRSGSILRTLEKEKKSFGTWIYATVFSYPDDEKRQYEVWERAVVRFEDLKCHPREELQKLCEKLEIEWSDTLLETTLHGEQEFYGNITGFDLTPVYRTHEEYFSPFDRFRLSLITGAWQKKHGYPCVSSLDFSRKELQEMFGKKFRFEEKIVYQSEEEKMALRAWVQKLAGRYLWENRRREVMERKDNRKG